jgi:hypothetical protein
MVSSTRGAATAGVVVVAAVFMVVFTATTMSPAGAAIEYRVCSVLFLVCSPTLPTCGARANQGGGVRTPPLWRECGAGLSKRLCSTYLCSHAGRG